MEATEKLIDLMEILAREVMELRKEVDKLKQNEERTNT